MISFYILLIILVILAIAMVVIYNRLVRQRILIQEAWSGISTFLQQRYDMIPKLVNIVKGYALHESQTLTRVVEWRNKAMTATSRSEQMDAGTGFNQALGNLFFTAEQYPDLKANTNFLDLQHSLQEMENKLNLARRYYNGTVRNYNTSIETFPNQLLANIFGFKKEKFFEEGAEAHEPPKVSFNP